MKGQFVRMAIVGAFLAFLIGVVAALPQNPQSATAPIYSVNAKYANGFAPGYWPTQQAVGSQSAATGLDINVGPGTVNCGSGAILTYAGGQFPMTASTTNYIYLNTGSSCAPQVKTTAFVGSDIPIAVVVAGSSTLTSIVDDRTPFNVPGSGSGWNGSGIPANTIFGFYGTSINDDDTHSLSPNITVTSYTQSGGSSVSFVNSGTNNFQVGDWISVRFVNGWGANLPSGMALGTGHTLFQVTATNGTTTFVLNTGSLPAQTTCSSSCGIVESAMSFSPFITIKRALSLPPNAINNVYVYVPAPVTMAGAAASYTTIWHPLSPSQNAGRPLYIFLNDHTNDDSIGSSTAAVQAGYSSFFTQAHADGVIVGVGTGITYIFNTFVGTSDSYQRWDANRKWLFQQGRTAATEATGAYWDILADTSTAILDGSNINFAGPASGTQSVMASAMANAISAGAGTPVSFGPWAWCAQPGTVQAAQGICFSPFADSGYALQVLSSDRLHMVARFDTNSWLLWVNNLTDAGAAAGSGHACLHIDTVGAITNTGSDCSAGGGTTTNPLTAAATGGASPGTTFNGSAAITFDYHSFGAAPAANPAFSGNVDASAAATAKLPVVAGCATLANGSVCYDSTNKNWHFWDNATDTLMVPLAAGFTSGHCAQPTLTGSTWTLVDAGGACGTSGGGTAWSALTSGTSAAAFVMGSGGSIHPSGTGIVDANEFGGVPFCTGFTPTSGQAITYTTASSPNPCYTAVTSGGGGVNGTPLRGISVASSAGGTVTHTLFAGSAIGDFAVLIQGSANGTTCPSGWTVQNGLGASFWQGRVCSETLTSTDISNGNVTWNSSGGSASSCLAVFVGATSGIRENIPSQNASPQTGVLTAGGSDLSTDTMIHCNTWRSGGSGTFATLNRGMPAGYTYDGSIGNAQVWVEYLNYDSVQTMNWNWNTSVQYYLASTVVAK